MPEMLPALIPSHEGVDQAESVSAVLSWCSNVDYWLTSCRLWKVPPTPRLGTIPLPQVAPDEDTSSSLAAAKPTNIKNGPQSGVSFFLPHQKSYFILTGLAIVRQPSYYLGFRGLPWPDRELRGGAQYLTRIHSSVSDPGRHRLMGCGGWSRRRRGGFGRFSGVEPTSYIVNRKRTSQTLLSFVLFSFIPSSDF